MTTTTPAYVPAELVAPGQTLADWLDRAGMTQADFAKRTNLTPKHINQVVKGGAGISPEVARAFERVTRIPARYWLQLDANYQSALQAQTETAALEGHTELVDLFPYRELAKLGVVEETSSKVERLRQLYRFFGVANRAALTEVALNPAMFRRSTAFEASDAALASWLRLAELEAAGINTAPFDAARCRDLLAEFRALSALPGIDWLEPLKAKAASAGIAIVIVKELPKCRVNGATRWLSPDKAMIALSLRHRRNDIFWFTLFHELCHLLKHSKKEVFIDRKTSGIDEDLENEADAFASRMLIGSVDAAELPSLKTEAQIVAFAAQIGVAPGIVVGRMQHLDLVAPNRFTNLFVRYHFADD